MALTRFLSAALSEAVFRPSLSVLKVMPELVAALRMIKFPPVIFVGSAVS